MKKHNFSPEQSELILNAVSNFYNLRYNTYSHAKFINSLSTYRLEGAVEREEGEKAEFSISPDYLLKVIISTEEITDFMYAIEDSVNFISVKDRIAGAIKKQKEESLAETQVEVN